MARSPEEELTALPRGTRARVSLVIAAALALVAYLSWLLSGGGTELLRPKFDLKTYLSDGTGLDKGADVRLNGVIIGKTKTVSIVPGTLDPNRVVMIDMEVQTRFLKDIPVDSVAALTADNIVGDKYVNITSGKSKELVEDGSEIPGLIQNGAFNPADLFESLKAALTNADNILTQIQTADTPIANFIRGTGFYQDLLAQVGKAQEAIATYADAQSPAGKLLFSDTMYNQIRQPILNMDRSLEEIQRGETAMGQFVTTTKAYDQAVAQVKSVHQAIRDTNAGKGPAGRLLTSDEQYEQLRGQLRALNQAVDNLTKGEGTFAQMLRSSEAYDSLAGQTAATREFLKDFREHPQKYLRIKLF